MQERSDEWLVRAFQKGDEAAYSEFVGRHQDRVYRVSRMWLDQPDMADDALQETFLRSYQGLTRFAFRAAPSTWLLRVCKNVCRELNRRQRRDRGAGFQPIEVLEVEDGAEVFWLQAENYTDVHRWIKQLPERQRQVVVLRRLEELSVAETARIMSCREGTVKALLHKAMAALRRHNEIDSEL